MIENILAGLVVAVAAFFVGRSFYRTLSGKKGCGCAGSVSANGGESSPCGGCGQAAACSDKYSDMFKKEEDKK